MYVGLQELKQCLIHSTRFEYEYLNNCSISLSENTFQICVDNTFGSLTSGNSETPMFQPGLSLQSKLLLDQL